MPGYDRETKEIVRTFAVRGYAALMPNLFHRYLPGAKWHEQSAAAREAGGVPDEQMLGDAQGAIDALRALDDSNGKVGVIGYCSGGRQTVVVACTLDVNAAVDCYGGGANPDLVSDLRCPLLGLFGEEDRRPSPADVAELEAALTAAGKDYEFHSYTDAGHGFFSVDYPMYRRDAAREGWKQIWKFFGEHLGG